MALENWVDKQDGIDDILAEDINSIANAVIETQKEINEAVDTVYDDFGTTIDMRYTWQLGNDGIYTLPLTNIQVLTNGSAFLIFNNEVVIIVRGSLEDLQAIGFVLNKKYRIEIRNKEIVSLKLLDKIVDQNYNPKSANAQSGKAVKEALNKVTNVLQVLEEAVSDKQDSLVSGVNIKTINNQSILGSGNITIEGGSDVEVDQNYNPTSENAQSGKAVAEAVAQKADKTEVDKLKDDLADLPMGYEWAKRELFDRRDLIDPGNGNTIVNIDGVEYYRYHANEKNFEWHNPYPVVGSVTITFRLVAQYGEYRTRMIAYYEDGTYDYIWPTMGSVGTFTSPANKALVKIVGNYDAENWILMDLSVMSIVANFNPGLLPAGQTVCGGVLADPATADDTVPVRLSGDGKLYTSGIVPPASASVGQTIRVAAVDENGKPTEWEAVGFPEGGGGASGGKWRLLNDITTTEEIAVQQGISLSSADDGTPYNLKEVVFLWQCPAAEVPTYATFRVNGKNRNFPAGVAFYFASGAFYNSSEKVALCKIKALGDAAVLHGAAGIDNQGSQGANVNVVYNYPKAFDTITSIDFTCFGNVKYPIGFKLTIWGLEV